MSIARQISVVYLAPSSYDPVIARDHLVGAQNIYSLNFPEKVCQLLLQTVLKFRVHIR